MSQPDDDDTKEQPAYQLPPEPPMPPEPPLAAAAPAGDAGAMPPAPMTPDEQLAASAAAAPPPMPPPMPPPVAPNQWQQPAPAASQWQQPAPPPGGPQGWQQTQPNQPAAQSWQQPAAQPPPAQQPPPAPQWSPAPPPAQVWQQPPQPQQWQQPAPGQWQQPGQYPQAQPWGAQPQPWAGPQYGTSPLVAFAGLLLIVFGIAVAVIGAWTLTQGPEIGRFIRDNDIAVFGRSLNRDTLRSVLSPMPGVLIVLGILQLLCGAGIFAHKSWARWLGFLASLLGVLVGIFAVSAAVALAPGLSIPMIVAVVLLLGYAYVLLALVAGARHFRARLTPR